MVPREMRNPYVAGNPLKTEEMFFGREDVFEYIRQHLVGRYQDNIIVLHGQKRTGKTSVLYQIMNRKLLGERYIPVYVDLQGMTQERLGGFLHDVASEIAMTLGLEMPARAPFEEDGGGHFRREFLKSVTENIGDRCLLLMLDEYEMLEHRVKQGKVEENVFPYLRHLMQHHDNLGFIFAGSHKLEELEKDYWSIFRNALYRKISFLEKEETRRLITEPVQGVMEYEDAAVEAIFQMTFGHPYFTQLLCHHLVNRYVMKSAPVTVQDVNEDSVVNEVVQAGEGQLQVMWNEASAEEKVILAAMSAASRIQHTVSLSALANVLTRYRAKLGQKEVNEALNSLVTKDVILIDEGFNYRFAVSFFRRWIENNRRLASLLEEFGMVGVDKQAERLSHLDEQRYAAARHAVLIGDGYRAKGQQALAIEKYGEAIAVYPSHIDAYLGLGAAYEGKGEDDRALESYERALSFDPTCVEGLNALGSVHRKRGRFEQAINTFKESLRYEPGNVVAGSNLVEIHYALGSQHFQAAQWPQAVEHFERIFAYDKTFRRFDIEEKLAKARHALAATSTEETAERGYPLVGRFIGGYEILSEEIGQGGMATVYHAYDTHRGRPVALKVLLPHLQYQREFVECLRREVSHAATLQHPCIVPIHDSGVLEDGRPYIAMTWAGGGSLADRLDRQHGPLPLEQTATILNHIAAALDYAHQRGVVHRDVKPSNVLFTGDGRAMLTDFGIAKAAGDSRLTGTGVRLGTPAYMAPEQARGQPVGPWTDIYALGVVLYEMLTGQFPFYGDTTDAVLYQHVHEPPSPLRSHNPALPSALERVVRRALAKDPRRRYHTAGKMVEDFARAIGRQVERRTPMMRGGSLFSRIKSVLGMAP